MQHSLAVMLLDNGVTFKSAHDFARMKDKQVLTLRKCIKAIGDPTLTDAERRWRCVMEIRLRNGRILKHQTLAAKGSYENPLTREEENDKATYLLAPVLGTKRATALLNALWAFDALKDVQVLRRFYSA